MFKSAIDQISVGSVCVSFVRRGKCGAAWTMDHRTIEDKVTPPLPVRPQPTDLSRKNRVFRNGLPASVSSTSRTLPDPVGLILDLAGR